MVLLVSPGLSHLFLIISRGDRLSLKHYDGLDPRGQPN